MGMYNNGKSYFILIIMFISSILINSVFKVSLVLAIDEIKVAKFSVLNEFGIGSGSLEIGLGRDDTAFISSNGPSSFAIDKFENIYLIDAINFRVLKFNALDTKEVEQIKYLPGGYSKNMKFNYVCDVAVSDDGELIYLLSQSLRCIFVLNKKGFIHKILSIHNISVLPSQISSLGTNEIILSDIALGRVIIFDLNLNVKGVVDDPNAKPYSNNGYVFTFGEFDEFGQDILLIDAILNRKSYVYAKILKTSKLAKVYDYQFLGLDKNLNVYATIIEKAMEIKEKVNEKDSNLPTKVNTICYKFNKDGKVVLRFMLPTLKYIADIYPTRYFNVSPNGNIYGISSNSDYTKFQIVRIDY